jgi:hypothetical protein
VDLVKYLIRVHGGSMLTTSLRMLDVSDDKINSHTCFVIITQV